MKVVKQVMFLIAIILLLIALYLSQKTFLLKWKGEQAVATIDSIIVGGGAYDEGVSYYYHYVFNKEENINIEGRTYVGDNSKQNKVGDHISIKFYEYDSTVNSPDTFQELFLIPIATFCIGILFLITGFVITRILSKKQ